MRKNLLILVIFMSTVLAANAQLDFSNMRVDLGANYTMYKGDFQEKTAGTKIRLSVPAGEKAVVGLGFTYGFPIKTPSEVSLSGGGSLPSEIVYKFKTISLEFDYYFGGENEEGFSVYGSGRAGLVLVNWKENIKGSIPSGQTADDQLEPGNENGFTLNLALGGQYSLSRINIFGDAGVAIPANQVNGQYVENVIPAHFMFNVGLRIPFGQRSE